MKVFTPGSTARNTGSKYLGVLVAAKYARNLNEFRRNEVFDEANEVENRRREKLTTTGLEYVASDSLEFRLSDRRPDEL
ncbi:hypothetical protein BH23GEM3_BH23GEM3_09170 [soil metagenome]|jgi:DNA-directed RNA polymerase omega subunit|nr:DNA-directed RNA polymerase subunit omega [Gemmatimonadota bacterium]